MHKWDHNDSTRSSSQPWNYLLNAGGGKRWQSAHSSCQLIWIPRETLFKVVQGRGEREFPFPSIPKNESLWFPFPNYGNGFFHSLPVPEFRECFFFIPFPFPNYGNVFFSFPSRSQIMGMFFFIPFPFLNCWNGFLSVPSCSQICHFTDRNKTGIGALCEIPDFQYFQLYLYFLQQFILRRFSLLVSDWKDREFCSVLLQIVMLQRC